MKALRTIIMILIIVLISSPALASICATSFVAQSVMSSLHPDDMSEMKNCHEGPANKNKPSTKHQSCAMGSGCHFTQVTSPTDLSSKSILANSNSISFPRFVSLLKSVDLSPPLKPPA